MIKILCLDYDNTIFDHRTGGIPGSAAEALDAARSRYKIVLASGRFFDDERNASIIDKINPDGIVHANGAKVEADGKVLSDTYLEEELMRDVFEYAYRNDLCLGGLYEGDWYTTNRENLIARWGESVKHYEGRFYDARELYGKKVHGLFLEDTVEAARQIEKAFPKLRTPIMDDIKGGADVIPCSISKAYGLRIILQHWGDTMETVAAIGDSMNDYEIIQEAGVGIAMGNAVTALKEAADYVTTPIWEDGIRNALLYLEGKESR